MQTFSYSVSIMTSITSYRSKLLTNIINCTTCLLLRKRKSCQSLMNGCCCAKSNTHYYKLSQQYLYGYCAFPKSYELLPVWLTEFYYSSIFLLSRSPFHNTFNVNYCRTISTIKPSLTYQSNIFMCIRAKTK